MGGKYVKSVNLAIEPNSPITIRAGQKFSFDIGLELIKEIPVGTRVKLHMKGVPCVNAQNLDIDIGTTMIGSCEYDIQKDICDGILKHFNIDLGSKCGLPMPVGKYGAEKQSIAIPQNVDIPDAAKELLKAFDGPVEITATFLSAAKKEIGKLAFNGVLKMEL